MWLNCLELCVLYITSHLAVDHCRHSILLLLAFLLFDDFSTFGSWLDNPTGSIWSEDLGLDASDFCKNLLRPT